MEETPSKRCRQEGEGEEESEGLEVKRHNHQQRSSYHHILSTLLEEAPEEVNATQDDLSSLITTLQHELASFPADPPLPSSEVKEDVTQNQVTHQLILEEEEEDAVKVIRHLLEASDDELGIPSREEDDEAVVFTEEREREVLVYDEGGVWEMEDEAANYYELLQSELFL